MFVVALLPMKQRLVFVVVLSPHKTEFGVCCSSAAHDIEFGVCCSSAVHETEFGVCCNSTSHGMVCVTILPPMKCYNCYVTLYILVYYNCECNNYIPNKKKIFQHLLHFCRP